MLRLSTGATLVQLVNLRYLEGSENNLHSHGHAFARRCLFFEVAFPRFPVAYGCDHCQSIDRYESLRLYGWVSVDIIITRCRKNASTHIFGSLICSCIKKVKRTLMSMTLMDFSFKPIYSKICL